MFESIGQGGGDLNPEPRKIDLPGDVGAVSRVSIGNYHILALTGMKKCINESKRRELLTQFNRITRLPR
jgi:hypothetical protein